MEELRLGLTLSRELSRGGTLSPASDNLIALLPVLVDNQISEPHRLHYLFRQGGIDDRVLFQKIRELVGAARDAEILFADHMGCHVDAVLDRLLKVE
jgi:hypothetical protein